LVRQTNPVEGGLLWHCLELIYGRPNVPVAQSEGRQVQEWSSIAERPSGVSYAPTRSFLGSERNFPFICKVLGQSLRAETILVQITG